MFPTAIYYEENNTIECVKDTKTPVYKTYNQNLAIGYDMDEDEVVGFKIYNVRQLIKTFPVFSA